jgi:hypothetical protein
MMMRYLHNLFETIKQERFAEQSRPFFNLKKQSHKSNNNAKIKNCHSEVRTPE